MHRRFHLPLILTLLFGVLISTLPHLIYWARTGSPVWIADTDELTIYLQTASQAYFNHVGRVTDPYFVAPRPTIYPWIQIIPGTFIAWACGLGPMAIGWIWRAWAGVTIAAGWFFALRFFLKSSWAACFGAVYLLSEGGLLEAKPLFRQFKHTLMSLAGLDFELFLGKPQMHPEWRIITPGLSLGALLLFVILHARARERPTRARIIASGLAFGLLVHTYFYFWIAVAGGLVLAMLIDRPAWRTHLHALWIGGLAGLPKLLADRAIQAGHSRSWMERGDLWVAIPRGSELVVPKAGLVLLIVLAIYVWRRRPDLRWLAGCAGAGYFLLTHQLVTGLQLQNSHWNYFWAPLTMLLFVLAIGDVWLAARRDRLLSAGFVALVLFSAALGLRLRYLEATRSTLATSLRGQYDRYVAQRSGAPALAPNGVVAGPETFVALASVLDNQRPLWGYSMLASPGIDFTEWNERLALNGLLVGQSREEFEAAQSKLIGGSYGGPWQRDPARRDEPLRARLAAFDRFGADLGAAVAHYGVRVVGIEAARETPAYLAAGGWRRVESGPAWQVWERQP
jgi:hypothetical protein